VARKLVFFARRRPQTIEKADASRPAADVPRRTRGARALREIVRNQDVFAGYGALDSATKSAR